MHATMQRSVLRRCRAELRSGLFIIRSGSTCSLHGYESTARGSIISTALTPSRQSFAPTDGSRCLPFRTNRRYHFEHYMPSHLFLVVTLRFVSSLGRLQRLP